MKVSIVTTCLNREGMIADAVNSVKNQSYDDIEHIIVDAASTDHTVDVIKACNSPRVTKLISEKDKGVYQGLNKGLRLVTGDIVGWLHSDDMFYDANVIADVVGHFKTTNCDVMYGNGLFVDTDNVNWVIRNWRSCKFSIDNLKNGWLPLHTTVFVRREVLERFGLYREDYRVSSDTEWLLRVLLHPDLKVSFFYRYIIIMRYGGLSTSWKFSIRKWREDLGIYKQYNLSPRITLIKKILRKIPQFLSAPFSRSSYAYHVLETPKQQEEK